MAGGGTRLLLVVASLAAALLASATATGAGPPAGAVQVAVEADAEERVVAYGRSQLLLIRPVQATQPGITRINLDGSVDTSFGDEGTVDIVCEDAAVSADGRILVSTSSHPSGPGGNSDARVTRLLPDGQPDPSFGVAGSADVDFGGRYDTGQAAALAPNGDILLAGYRQSSGVIRGENEMRPAVARLRRDGSLDRSFGREGVSILASGGEIEILDIALTPEGGIVVDVGNEIESILWKLTRDGSVDRHFGKGGWLEVRGKRKRNGWHEEAFLAPQLAVLPSGKLLLAATGSPNRGPDDWFRAVAVRLRPDGRVDRSYGDDGWAAARKGTLAAGLTLLPGGILAIATSFESSSTDEQRDFGAIAFGPDGHLERRFGKDGRCRAKIAGRDEALGVVTLGRSAAIVGYGGGHQRLLDCPLVPGGPPGERTARATTTGHLDRDFGSGGLRYLPPSFGATRGAALLPDGRIVVGGEERVLALLPSGRIDAGFGNGGYAPIVNPGSESVETSGVSVDPRGRPVVIASLFDTELGPDGTVTGAGLRSIVERYTASGELDAGFGGGSGYAVNDFGLPPAPASEMPYVIADEAAFGPDGGIFLYGSYTIGTTQGKVGPNLVSAAFLAHLSASGQWDRSFAAGGVLRWEGPSAIGAPTVGPGGEVFVPVSDRGGSVLRLRANGKTDTRFGKSGYAVYPRGTSSSPVLVDSRKRIVVFGYLSGVEHRLPNGFLVRRLRSDGSLDRSFGNGGAVTLRLPRSYVAELALDERGRILVAISLKARGPAGEPEDLTLLRLRTDGRIDRSFGRDGQVAIPFAGRPSVYLEGLDVRGGEALVSARYCGHGPCRPVLALVDLGPG
jgi:uncharacterized delta-60 repeat protein